MHKLASKNINSNLAKYKVNLGPAAGGLRGLSAKKATRRAGSKSPNRILGGMPDDFFAEAAFDNKEFSKEVASRQQEVCLRLATDWKAAAQAHGVMEKLWFQDRSISNVPF